MKKISSYILVIILFPVLLFAQYSGGNGRGDASAVLTNFPLQINEALPENPLQYNLMQNYPNPLNPVTKIQFSIPQYSKVIIKVFNILGIEIETLVEQEKPAGTYEINWSAANKPSGIYCYQLHAVPADGKTNSFFETRKMIVIK